MEKKHSHNNKANTTTNKAGMIASEEVEFISIIANQGRLRTVAWKQQAAIITAIPRQCKQKATFITNIPKARSETPANPPETPMPNNEKSCCGVCRASWPLSHCFCPPPRHPP